MTSIHRIIESLKLIIKKNDTDRMVCTISTISSKINKAYLTPVRHICDITVFGVVIGSLNDLEIIIKKIDYKNVYFFIDMDSKKIDGTSKSIMLEVSSMTKNPRIVGYKPNDITVYSTWQYLINEYSVWNKVVYIVGAGNIGSKLALMLSESGARVYISRRNHCKGKKVSSILNLISSKKDGVTYVEDFNFGDKDRPDIIIGAGNENNIINSKQIFDMKVDSVMIELGKGTFSSDAICSIKEKELDFYRVDVSDFLLGYIFSALSLKQTIKNKFGIKRLGDLNIVSGGYMGGEGDIVVDNINSPDQVIGISDGMGGFMPDLNINIDKILTKIRLRISNE